jgi:hypothetical protein
VIEWVPNDRSLVEKDPPAPMGPSKFEVQDKSDVRSPSSASLAEPENAISDPSLNVEPLDGAVMVTVGKVFCTSLME